MKRILYIACLFAISVCNAQSTETADKKAIHTALKKQRMAWSKGNIDEYMEGFWKSDSLKFYSTSGLTSSWHNILEKHEKGYPSLTIMGSLNFKINAISKIGNDSYYVLGEHHLKRTIGNVNSIFMAVFKKINKKWKIIAYTTN